nr:MAG TPA: hypothetical protein [Caudoviricetes sp.]
MKRIVEPRGVVRTCTVIPVWSVKYLKAGDSLLLAKRSLRRDLVKRMRSIVLISKRT